MVISVKKVIVICLLIGLFGTVTNYVFLSPLPSLISLLVLPIFLIRQSQLAVPRYVFYLYLYFIYSIVGVLLYNPSSLINFGFYRYDGNFIISYTPLLLIPFFAYNFPVEKAFRWFLLFCTGINALAFVATLLLTRFGILYNWSNPENYFHGLFKSTNGAGGFISIILSLNIVFYLKERTRRWLILIVLNTIFLLATTSRGSLLGLLAGFSFFFLLRVNKAYLIKWVLLVIVLIQSGILYFTYPLYVKYVRNVDLEAFSKLGANAYLGPAFGGATSTKSANLLIRLIDTWPRAVDGFIHSPIFGLGFGSINDIPFYYGGWPYLVSWDTQSYKPFNDSHAHHSYLHILGEQGLVGLGIFLLFWYSIYIYLKKGPDTVVRNFLLVSYFNLSIMSFTEHRITSPSNALPFVITLCLYILKRNYTKRQNRTVTMDLVQ